MEIIAAICRRNPGVDPAFLDGFEDPQLLRYLCRLTQLDDGRARGSVWVREAETPAVVMRRAG
jgi:hypothetical protein